MGYNYVPFAKLVPYDEGVSARYLFEAAAALSHVLVRTWIQGEAGMAQANQVREEEEAVVPREGPVASGGRHAAPSCFFSLTIECCAARTRTSAVAAGSSEKSGL